MSYIPAGTSSSRNEFCVEMLRTERGVGGLALLSGRFHLKAKKTLLAHFPQSWRSIDLKVREVLPLDVVVRGIMYLVSKASPSLLAHESAFSEVRTLVSLGQDGLVASSWNVALPSS